MRGSMFAGCAFVALLAGVAQVEATGRSEDVITFSPVQKFSDDSVVPGSVSTLIRGFDRVGVTIDTRMLAKKAPYTVWWIVFNNPEQCMEPCACGEVDLGDPEVNAGVFWATGRLSDKFGQASFSGFTEEFALPEGDDQTPIPVPLIGASAPRSILWSVPTVQHSKATISKRSSPSSTVVAAKTSTVRKPASTHSSRSIGRRTAVPTDPSARVVADDPGSLTLSAIDPAVYRSYPRAA